MTKQGAEKCVKTTCHITPLAPLQRRPSFFIPFGSGVTAAETF